jgi:glycosyltransferase involved in cell wall biosynthesis/GNAT superfamily N-acetyltransferase
VTGRPSNRLLFIGFHSTRDGSSPESQNELVAALLADHGFDIRSGSSQPRQIARMIDQLVLLLRNLGWADAVVVDAFSGRRFWTPVAVVRIARLVGLPAVVVLHGGRLPEFTQTHESRVLSTLRLASRLVAPSPYLERSFRDRGLAVSQVPNLVDLTPMAEAEDAHSGQRILWMRAFDEEYRPSLAVEAFAVVAENRPHAVLTMAGPDRGLLPEVERLVTERGLGGRVAFPGYLAGDEKAVAFRDHDVFLNTTSVDNTPVSVLEALAAGLPVVATDVGGLRDLLNGGQAGVLIGSDEPSSVAAGVDRVLTDPELRQQLREAGAVVVERFRPEAVVASWASLFRGLGVSDTRHPDDGCGPLSLDDLDEVTDLHGEAFPDSALTQLGRRVVRAYYRWQFIGPHPAPVALGVWRDGRLVGYLFGGVRQGAIVGFVRQAGPVIAAGVARHPRAVQRLALPKVVAVGRAIVAARRPSALAPASGAGVDRTPGPPDAPVRTERSFGVLSIAVADSARGTGAAAELMAAAERQAAAIGCARMNLTVNPQNSRAVGFYEKLGWVVLGGRDGAMVKHLVGV